MLKRLPIALAEVKTGNNLKTLLNEITKKVYNNIINSIKV